MHPEEAVLIIEALPGASLALRAELASVTNRALCVRDLPAAAEFLEDHPNLEVKVVIIPEYIAGSEEGMRILRGMYQGPIVEVDDHCTPTITGPEITCVVHPGDLAKAVRDLLRSAHQAALV